MIHPFTSQRVTSVRILLYSIIIIIIIIIIVVVVVVVVVVIIILLVMYYYCTIAVITIRKLRKSSFKLFNVAFNSRKS